MNQMIRNASLAQVISLPVRIFNTPATHRRRKGGGIFRGIEKLPRNYADQITVTKRKVGKVTYVIESSPSATATETIDRKIEGLILREIQRNTVKT